MDEKLYFTGTIEAIFFENPSNFYKVMLIELTDTNSDYLGTEIVVNGIIGQVIEGESYTFTGQLVNHPKYGEQVKVESYEKNIATSGAGLIKYLSGERFPGIGRKTAEKIVDLYPDDTIDTILENPENLRQVLSDKKQASFVRRLSENHGMDKILAKLSQYELPAKINYQIYDFYKDKTLDIIEKNPYQLVIDIKGIGFKTADKIASELDISATSTERYKAGLMHVMTSHGLASGDTYIEARSLLEKTIDLLETSRLVEVVAEDIALVINELIEDGLLQQEGTKIFENSLYFAEEGISESVKRLSENTYKDNHGKKLTKVITEIEQNHNIEYDNLQKEAIKSAMNNQFMLLTGGPGTGKTTVINGILEAYSELYDVDLNPDNYTDDVFPIILAAPTGRAARRMNELTGLPSATIHRHLGLGNDDNDNLDEGLDLSGSLLIVDEFSMVDTWLANKLFAAIPPSMKVIIVGDADQLPSVGPGQVLADLLKISDIESVKLDKVFRQDDNSTITDLAHDIKDGHLPVDFADKKADRSYFSASAGQIPNLIEQIAKSWSSKGNNPFELQVLIPMYKGLAGINNINKLLQNIFNPLTGGLEFSHQDTVYRSGDKVLHLVNEPSLNVFNGDIGYITDLVAGKYTDSKQDEIIMDFDGVEVIYPRSEWYKITLAYAMSIHKAQGSEFSSVVVPMVSSYSRMLERNLLYTAVTRAKKSLICLGDYGAFEQAVAKVGGNRKTYLLERFGMSVKNQKPVEVSEDLETYKQEEVIEPILTEKLINNSSINPLIGLSKEDWMIFEN